MVAFINNDDSVYRKKRRKKGKNTLKNSGRKKSSLCV